MSEELKPCPFCGGEAKIKAGGILNLNFVIKCECTKCHAKTTGYTSNIKEDALDRIEECKNLAIKAWNRRIADER